MEVSWKSPETQAVSILYELGRSKTTFSPSFSPSAEIEREIQMHWKASASLVRRELLNIGFDETDDKLFLYDVSIEPLVTFMWIQ